MSDFKIVDELQPLARDIGKAEPVDDNTRGHNERNKEAIRDSLEQFGQRKPIVVNKNTGKIEAGNALYQVAVKEFGAGEIAMVMVDDTEDEAKGFEIADNRTAELAEWLDEELEAAVEDLTFSEEVDHERIGWDPEELDAIMSDVSVRGEDEESGSSGSREASPQESIMIFIGEYKIVVKERDQVIKEKIEKLRELGPDQKASAEDYVVDQIVEALDEVLRS